jgi:hypothetical protein
VLGRGVDGQPDSPVDSPAADAPGAVGPLRSWAGWRSDCRAPTTGWPGLQRLPCAVPFGESRLR